MSTPVSSPISLRTDTPVPTVHPRHNASRVAGVGSRRDSSSPASLETLDTRVPTPPANARVIDERSNIETFVGPSLSTTKRDVVEEAVVSVHTHAQQQSTFHTDHTTITEVVDGKVVGRAEADAAAVSSGQVELQTDVTLDRAQRDHIQTKTTTPFVETETIDRTVEIQPDSALVGGVNSRPGSPNPASASNQAFQFAAETALLESSISNPALADALTKEPKSQLLNERHHTDSAFGPSSTTIEHTTLKPAVLEKETHSEQQLTRKEDRIETLHMVDGKIVDRKETSTATVTADHPRTTTDIHVIQNQIVHEVEKRTTSGERIETTEYDQLIEPNLPGASSSLLDQTPEVKAAHQQRERKALEVRAGEIRSQEETLRRANLTNAQGVPREGAKVTDVRTPGRANQGTYNKWSILGLGALVATGVGALILGFAYRRSLARTFANAWNRLFHRAPKA